MTTGKFITHLNLTLFGYIDLSHLKNTGRQLVANGNGELATLHFSIKLLVLADIIHDELLNQAIGMSILRPIIRLNSIIFKILQRSSRKLGTLSDDFCTGIVFHTFRNHPLCQGQQLVNENILQVVVLGLILLINLGKDNLILFFGLPVFDGAGEKLLVYYDTAQRRVGFQ